MQRRIIRLIVALIVLAALVAAYLLAVRPTLTQRDPFVPLVEYPIAVALISFLLWQGLRPETRARPTPAQALRRHEQIVRTLPDPDATALEAALAAWIDTGDDAARTADILARAQAVDAASRAAERERLAPLLAAAESRKARARLLRSYLKTGD